MATYWKSPDLVSISLDGMGVMLLNASHEVAHAGVFGALSFNVLRIPERRDSYFRARRSYEARDFAQLTKTAMDTLGDGRHTFQGVSTWDSTSTGSAAATPPLTPSGNRIAATDDRSPGRSGRGTARIPTTYSAPSGWRRDDTERKARRLLLSRQLSPAVSPCRHRNASPLGNLRPRCATAGQPTGLRAETGATPSRSRQIGSIAHAGAYAGSGVAPVSARS